MEIKIIKYVECCCYLGFWIRNKCCPGSNETFMIGDFARPPGPPRNHELDFRYIRNNRIINNGSVIGFFME